MSTERHVYIVKSSSPPVVEVDRASMSVYVRFKKTKIDKTIPTHCESMHLAVDLDIRGEVVGIEAVGITEFVIGVLMKKASVRAPAVDFSRTRYVPADTVCA